jgi:hypothetical protein
MPSSIPLALAPPEPPAVILLETSRDSAHTEMNEPGRTIKAASLKGLGPLLCGLRIALGNRRLQFVVGLYPFHAQFAACHMYSSSGLIFTQLGRITINRKTRCARRLRNRKTPYKHRAHWMKHQRICSCDSRNFTIFRERVTRKVHTRTAHRRRHVAVCENGHKTRIAFPS